MADQCRQVFVYYGDESLWLESAIFAFFRAEGLSGREREGKLTREVLSVLMVAQRSTRRRVEWIK